MNYEQKRFNIEENYLNGNISDARAMFKKLPKETRKKLLSDIIGGTYYQMDSSLRLQTLKFVNFLIDSL